MARFFNSCIKAMQLKDDKKNAVLINVTLLLIAIIAICVYVSAYANNCFGDPIRADGVGYCSYLSALIVDHDITMETMALKDFGGEIPRWTGIRKVPKTSMYAAKYTMGVAVMIAPFYIIAHVMAVLLSHIEPGNLLWSPTGWSFLYQHAAGLSGLIYGLAGIFILSRILAARFSGIVTMATLLIIIFGSNLLHYITGESVLSHAYSFFLFCAMLYYIPVWYMHPCSVFRSLVMGMILGMIVLVRIPNIVFFLCFILYGVESLQDMRQRVFFFCKNAKSVFIIIATVGLVMMPQMIYWRYVVGRWVLNVYATIGEGFIYKYSPRILDVLFSLRGGLFFWAPLMILVIPGLYYMHKCICPYFWSVLGALLLHLYIIASWHMWELGGGFGHRGFVEAYALFALAIASLLSRVKRPLLIPMVILVLLGIAYELFFMCLYYTREISYFGLNYDALYDILWIRKEWLMGVFESL